LIRLAIAAWRAISLHHPHHAGGEQQHQQIIPLLLKRLWQGPHCSGPVDCTGQLPDQRQQTWMHQQQPGPLKRTLQQHATDHWSDLNKARPADTYFTCRRMTALQNSRLWHKVDERLLPAHQFQGKPTSLLQLLQRDKRGQGRRTLHLSQKSAAPIAQALEHVDQGLRRRRQSQGTPPLISKQQILTFVALLYAGLQAKLQCHFRKRSSSD
jgi:hypothetical protein